MLQSFRGDSRLERGPMGTSLFFVEIKERCDRLFLVLFCHDMIFDAATINSCFVFCSLNLLVKYGNVEREISW